MLVTKGENKPGRSSGEVETAEQKSHIGSIASQVKGVKQVVNNLQVIKRWRQTVSA
jgi:BON domain